MNKITQPIERNKLRQWAGKEFYILKRKWQWLTSKKSYARVNKKSACSYSIFKHKSLVLRPLKDVEMYLQHNKRINLELAIKHLNEVEINPEEYFSLWKLVGRPTKRKGYLEGLVLKNGKAAKDTGGGLCQLGNLLFWIFAHSPLTVVERHRHGFDVFPDVKRKVPFGAGATLSYNYIDLQVKNTTANRFKLNVWLDETHLHGELVAEHEVKENYRVEERNHQIKQQYWGGYSRHNQIYKVVTNNGLETESLLVENHAVLMYEPLLGASAKTVSSEKGTKPI